MILRRIRVEAFRGFRLPLEVGPLGDGLNLVFGPNETGKSTLVAALARALFDRYSVGGEKAEADMRPWGTNLTPRVTVEFEAADASYRLEKAFLDAGRHAVLHRSEEGRWIPWLQGDEADDRVRALLLAEGPKTGLAKAAQWGIAQTLWSLQQPGEPSFCLVPDAVANQIRGAAQSVSELPLDRLVKRIEAACEPYFTPTGRQTKQSPVAGFEEEAARLDTERSACIAAIRSAEADAQRLDETAAALAHLAEERAGRERRVVELREAEQGLVGLRARLERLEADLSRAEEARRRTERQRAELSAATEALATHERAAEALRPTLEAQRVALAAARQNHAAAVETQRGAAEARQAEAARHRRAARAEDARRMRAALAALDEAIAEVEALEEEVRADRASLETLQPLADEAAVERARELTREIERCRARIEAASLRVEVTLERSQEVAFEGGAEPEEHRASEGDSLAYSAGTEIAVSLAGVARLRVTTGGEALAALQARTAKLRAELGDLLAPYAGGSPEELTERRSAARLLEQRIAARQETARARSGNDRDLPGMRRRRAEVAFELERALAELGITLPDLAALPADNPSLLDQDLRRAEEAEQAATGRTRELERQGAEIADRVKALEAEETRLARERDAARTAAEGVLRAAEVTDDAALESRLATHAAECEHLGVEVEEVRASLPAPEADPARIRLSEEAALTELGRRRDELLGEQGRLRSALEGAAGLYGRLGDLEARREVARAALALERRRAQAHRLLRDLLHHHRAASSSARLPGLEERIARMFRAVTGRERRVQLGGDLALAGVVDDATGTEQPPDRLSAGTREQLDLLVRVALGEAYAEQRGRTLLLLDDTLTYTDPARHERVREILRIAGEKLQVVILSSHQERYRGLVAPECQFDLAALRRAASE